MEIEMRMYLAIMVATFILATLVAGYGIRYNKGSIWTLFALLMSLGGAMLFMYKQENMLIDTQKTVIRTELEDRFYLSGLDVDLVDKETNDLGNRYAIESENGQYSARFNKKSYKGFELNEQAGESLRGRKNAYEAMDALPPELLSDSYYLEYQDDQTYTLETESGEWTIFLTDSVVRRIVDEEGITRYKEQKESTTYEGEMKEDDQS